MISIRPLCLVSVLLFIAIAVVAVTKVQGRLRCDCNGLYRRVIDRFSADVGCLKDYVLDRIRWNLARVFFKDHKVCQFAGRD